MSIGVNETDQARNYIDTLVRNNTKYESEIAQLQGANERLQVQLNEQKAKLELLKPYEDLIGNVPEEFTFTIKNHELIVAIANVCIKKNKSNVALFKKGATDNARTQAIARVDKFITGVLKDAFMSKDRMYAIMKRQMMTFDGTIEKVAEENEE